MRIFLVLFFVIPSILWAQTQEENPSYPDVVSSIRWEPNGERLLITGRIASEIWGVWLYDASGRNSLEIWHSDSLVSAHWSPDGTYLSVGRNIMDAQTLEILLTLDANSGIGGWTPDGAQVFARTHNNEIGFFNARTGQLDHTLPRDGDLPEYTSLSPDGNYWINVPASGEATLIRLEDNHSMILPVRYPSISWSADSRYIAMGFIEIVEEGTPNTLPFAPSPTLASIAIWDVVNEIVVRRYDGLMSSPTLVRWHPNNREFAVGTPIGLVYVFDIEQNTPINLLSTISGLGSIAYSPHGGRLVIGANSLNHEPIDTQRESLLEREALLTAGHQWSLIIVDHTLMVTVPNPSLERLSEISQCIVSDASSELAREALSVGESLTRETLPEFVGAIERLPNDAIPISCRADLLAVAEALQMGE